MIKKTDFMKRTIIHWSLVAASIVAVLVVDGFLISLVFDLVILPVIGSQIQPYHDFLRTMIYLLVYFATGATAAILAVAKLSNVDTLVNGLGSLQKSIFKAALEEDLAREKERAELDEIASRKMTDVIHETRAARR